MKTIENGQWTIDNGKRRKMSNEKGQLILILILVMTVALSIGLSIVQKSLVDISTSSKVEQSSRAFSAAEAGVEKALTGDKSSQIFGDNNSKIAEIQDTGLLPAAASVGSRQAALEFPPLSKEDVTQVWLADPNSVSNPPAAHYSRNSLDLFWGNSPTDRAALELTLVSHSAGNFLSRKFYFDQVAARTTTNGFTLASSCGGHTIGINTYQCKETLNFTALESTGLMLLRARLLYNSTSQPLAVRAVESCPSIPCTAYSLPPQARSIISTGVSGETQRKVKLFQLNKVVLPYFDYAIFSSGEINK